MVRTGYTVISENRNRGKPAKCASCGKKGVYRVTFEDCWSKLIVTLCDECKGKRYEELNLQSSLDWQGIA